MAAVADFQPSYGYVSPLAAVRTALGPPVDAVAKPSQRWEDMAKLRALPRALMGGTAAMRLAGRTYLPQHPAEAPISYAMRLNSTTLYNGFAETVTSQAGKFFVEPIVLKDTVPEEIKVLCENIDGQGRALTPFVADGVKEGFTAGVSFILVDYPTVATGTTLADQKATGARPYWVMITADDLIGLRTENQNGKQVITQARIRECVDEADGEFGQKEVERIRVLEPGYWAIYEKRTVDGSNEPHWYLISEGISSLRYVPLVPIYVNRVGYMEGAPPLRTLAELNQEHWISSSEQRRALSFLRFAMLKITGLPRDNTQSWTIAPDKVLELPVGVDAAYVEHSGSGIDAGASDLKAIEERMQHAGMEIRLENAGNVTATVAAIDSADSNAALRAVGKSVEDAIEQALSMTADILNIAAGGEVEVNDDFGSKEIPGTVAELTQARAASNISLVTYLAELKRRQVLDEDLDIDKEVILLADETAAALQQQQDFFAAQQPQVDAQGNPIQPQAGL